MTREDTIKKIYSLSERSIDIKTITYYLNKIYDDFENETAMCKNCVMFETINCPLDYEIRNKKEFCYDDFGCKGFIKKAD